MRLARVLFAAILLTLVLPFQLLMIPLYVMMRSVGLLNSLTGVIVAVTAAPGNAASRLENFVLSTAAYASGGYPDLDDLIKQQAQERDRKRRDVKPLARTVDRLVMQPLRPLLGPPSTKPRRIYLAPDGSLNLLPFAALVDGRGQYLVQNYVFSYLTSGRDLLRMQRPQPSKNAPLVVANPLFGKGAAASERGTRKSTNSLLNTQNGRRQEVPGDPARIFFSPLPGTHGEALAIKALLPEASLLLQSRATEAALKAAHAPRILHIATHGFFLAAGLLEDFAAPGQPSFLAGGLGSDFVEAFECGCNVLTL